MCRPRRKPSRATSLLPSSLHSSMRPSLCTWATHQRGLVAQADAVGCSALPSHPYRVQRAGSTSMAVLSCHTVFTVQKALIVFTLRSSGAG